MKEKIFGHEFEVIRIDPGNSVLCDFCGEEYTHRPDRGGILFGSKAACPTCTARMMPDIVKYDEEHFIRARCPEYSSFADFLRQLRNDSNS